MKLRMMVGALGLVMAAQVTGQVPSRQEVSNQVDSALATAQRIASRIMLGDADYVIDRSDPKFIEKFGGKAKLRAYVTDLPVRYGKELKLDHERLRLRAIGPIFARIVAVEKAKPLRLQFGFDGTSGLINSLFVEPAASKGTPVPPRPAKTRLTLPFGMPRTGHVWVLSNGGGQVLDNYHPRLDTHYAIDISPRPLNALTDVSSPSANPCWGLPIKAAADGRVAVTKDGLEDGPVRGPSNPGNHVILDHGNGEFTLYAHLQQGSVSVANNQRVTRGQDIGRCGSSGNTEAPHLHFQLMDGSDLQSARGIPPVFYDYYAPLRYVERGELLAGDVVLPAIPLGRTAKD